MKTKSTLLFCILISLLLNDIFAQEISWTPINSGLTETNIRSVIAPEGFIFAATNSGVYRYSGAVWEKVDNGMNSEYVNSLFSNSIGGVFAACENGAVYTTQDYGMNWTRINSGLGNFSVYSITQNSSGDIFIGTSGTGVYRTTDNGTNWTQINNGFTFSDVYINCLVTADSDVLLAGTGNDGLYRSTDNGDSWNQVFASTAFLYLAKDNSGNLYGCTTNGLLKSEDNGILWQSINNGLTTTYVNGIAFNRAGELFAATYGGGVFKSTDYGNFWQQQNSGLTPTNIWSLTVNSTGYLFAGSSDAGVYRTVDQTTSVKEDLTVSSFSLEQNYPNPFNPATRIKYNIPALNQLNEDAQKVRLKIYDILGNEIALIVNQVQTPGSYEVEFDGGDLSSGIYFYRLDVENNFSSIKKMLLLK